MPRSPPDDHPSDENPLPSESDMLEASRRVDGTAAVCSWIRIGAWFVSKSGLDLKLVSESTVHVTLAASRECVRDVKTNC